MIMKNILVTLLPSVLLLSACHFSAGVKKDLVTGLTIKNNALSYEDYQLMKGGQKLTDNSIAYGEMLVLRFTGVKYFKEEGGKVFPGMELTLKDNTGKVLLNYADMLKDVSANGVSATEAATMKADLTIGPPVKTDQTCQLELRIYDKKGDGSIVATMPLHIKRPAAQPGLSITPQGLTTEIAFVADGNGKLNGNEAVTGGKVGIIFYGLKGFTTENGKVFPGGDITIVGTDGKQKLKSEDVFASSAINGISQEEVERSVRLTLETNSAMKGDQSLWTFRVWDKKSQASIQASILLKLQ